MFLKINMLERQIFVKNHSLKDIRNNLQIQIDEINNTSIYSSQRHDGISIVNGKPLFLVTNEALQSSTFHLGYVLFSQQGAKSQFSIPHDQF